MSNGELSQDGNIRFIIIMSVLVCITAVFFIKQKMRFHELLIKSKKAETELHILLKEKEHNQGIIETLSSGKRINTIAVERFGLRHFEENSVIYINVKNSSLDINAEGEGKNLVSMNKSAEKGDEAQ